MNKYVAYYRTSTSEQKLGILAQREAVKTFTKNCIDCIIAEFTEVENSSGKNDKRIELAKAIEYAQKNNATLLISKLDRLSRNASFIFKLKDTKVDFKCCDMPDANTLTIGIFATLAQHERELIASRTSSALQAKKIQLQEKREKLNSDFDESGKLLRLGNPLGFNGIQKALDTRRANAQSFLSSPSTSRIKNRIIEVIELAQFKKQSVTLQIISDKLHESHFKTIHDNDFTPQNLVPLLKVVLKELGLETLPKFEKQPQRI